MTMANYKATFQQLAEEFRKYPDKLYIYVTSPPLVPESTTAENAQRARQFNNWLKDEFLPDYRRETGLSNLMIFDLFAVLADENGYLKDEFRRDRQADSHPNSDGNRAAASGFMDFFRPVWNNWQAVAGV